MFVLPQCKQDAACRRAPRDKNREGNAKKKKEKKKKGNPRRQRTAFAVRKKTAMRQVIRRWSDPAEAEEESSSTVTVSAEKGKSCTGSRSV